MAQPAGAADADERMTLLVKRKLAPYQSFVRKVLSRTSLTPKDAMRRDGEPLDAMLERVVAALDASMEKARTSAPAPAPAPEKPKKHKAPPRPILWRPSEGRKYPYTRSPNYHPDTWTANFPSVCFPLELGREVYLPNQRYRAIIVGYNPRMRKNKVMLLAKAAAQQPLDYHVLPEEIHSWSPKACIKYLRDREETPPEAVEAGPEADPPQDDGYVSEEPELAWNVA